MHDAPTSSPFRRSDVLLAVLLLVVAGGFVSRFAAIGFEEAVAELRDGDADRERRRLCLQVIRERGLARAAADANDLRAAELAAAAALLLQDEPAWRTAVGLAGSRSPLLPGGRGKADPARLAEAALGEPALESLFRGFAAQTAGQVEAAREEWLAAARSARLSRDALVERVASAALH